MKKLVLLLAVVFSASLFSCGNGEKKAEAVDTTATETVDTTAATTTDSAATVDTTAKADTTVKADSVKK